MHPTTTVHVDRCEEPRSTETIVDSATIMSQDVICAIFRDRSGVEGGKGLQTVGDRRDAERRGSGKCKCSVRIQGWTACHRYNAADSQCAMGTFSSDF